MAVAEPAVEPEPEEEEEEVDENAPPLGPPTKRTGPAITMMGRNKLVIFGGESEEVSLEDFVTLDLNAGTLKWVEHKPEGELFKPRKGAAICALKDVVYVFGGIYRDEDDDKEVLMEDFFMLKADGDTVIAESIPLKGMAVPEARAFGILQSSADDTLMLFGGVAGNNPMNDAFSFNCSTQEWTRVYRADPSMSTPTGELATLHAGRLLKVSSGGGNRFDVIATLDLAHLAESFTFAGVMKNGVTRQIDVLEQFFNTTEGAFGMADDPEKLEESFDFLLKVMGALYNVKTRKMAIDLELDCIEETLHELASTRSRHRPTTSDSRRLGLSGRRSRRWFPTSRRRSAPFRTFATRSRRRLPRSRQGERVSHRFPRPTHFHVQDWPHRVVPHARHRRRRSVGTRNGAVRSH